MNQLSEFLVRHGYLLIFGWVLVEQAGLPIPAAPLLLAAGALAGTGRLNLAFAIGLAALAALLSDFMWYFIGRRKGASVLRLLCRISLEPDSCVRRTQIRFERQGPRLLLISKFIPGLNAMMPPLSGIGGMRRREFLFFDSLGALIWAASYNIVGYVFHGQLELIVARMTFMGRSLLAVVVAAFVGYIAWKFYNRKKFLRSLRISRITPEELKQKLDDGEDVVIVDLRHALDFAARPETIRGALHMDAADLEEAHEVIPRDREIILFCACPNEATAARLALQLRSKGITRIRPLAEGYDGWRRRGFPMGPAKEDSPDADAASAEPAKA